MVPWEDMKKDVTKRGDLTERGGSVGTRRTGDLSVMATSLRGSSQREGSVKAIPVDW